MVSTEEFYLKSKRVIITKYLMMIYCVQIATFTKKATGRIIFKCNEGSKIDEAITKAIETGEGQTVWLSANGVNAEGVEVSSFNFEWTLKVKS